MNKVGIIIPAYEPDARMIELLKKLDSENMGPVYIIDDGSGEEYAMLFQKAANIISRLDGKVLTHEVNKGKGRALKTAFQYVLENNSNINFVVTADSDGQHSTECIKRIVEAVEEKCLVLGVRKFDSEEVPWKSRFGNSLTEKVFKYVSGIRVTDTQTGLRGIPREYMKELLDLKGERFEFEMRMLLDAADRYTIIEVPIKTIYDSKDNHQTHFKPVKDSIKIYKILGEKFFRYIFSSLSSSIVDLIVFAFVCTLLKNSNSVLYITSATIVARVISSVYNYCINRKYVFMCRKGITSSAIKYFALVIVQMICSAVLVTLFVRLFSENVEVLIKVLVDSFLFFVSYHIQQKIVFK